MHETKTSFGTRGGTWPARRRILCHGGADKLEGTETIGMAFSTDLVHWTPVRTGAFFLFLELFTLLSFYFWNFSFRFARSAGPRPSCDSDDALCGRQHEEVCQAGATGSTAR